MIWAAIAVIALAAVLIYRYTASRPEMGDGKPAPAARSGGERTIPVSVFIVEYDKIEEGIRALGTLLSNEEVEIASEVAGKVDKISFNEGQQLKKGELMVKINDDDLQSQLKRAHYQRNLLKERLERNRILLDKDAISREAFDVIETDYNMVEADIELLNVKIAKTDIRTPFEGQVGFRQISLGAYIQPGTPIARLIDNSKLKLQFSIPEKYFRDVRVGTPVEFTTQGSATIHRASVYAIDPKVDEMTRSITLRALYDNTGRSLLPGMYASIAIGQKRGTTISIPTEAIVPEADHTSVWVVHDQRAVSVPVVTGTRTSSRVEILRGLEQGDSVIVSGLLQVRDGSKVQVTN